MKRISTLTLTAVLLFALAVPAFAAGNDGMVGNGTTNDNVMRTRNADMADRTPAGDFNRATAPMRNAFGMRDTNRNMLPDTGNYRTNTVRTTAAADRNDVDWGWLGLAGLIGLAGLRGRDRERSK